MTQPHTHAEYALAVSDGDPDINDVEPDEIEYIPARLIDDPWPDRLWTRQVTRWEPVDSE